MQNRKSNCLSSTLYVEEEEEDQKNYSDLKYMSSLDSSDYKGQLLQHFGSTATDAVKITSREAEGNKFVGVVVLVKEGKTLESEPRTRKSNAEREAAFKAQQYLSFPITTSNKSCVPVIGVNLPKSLFNQKLAGTSDGNLSESLLVKDKIDKEKEMNSVPLSDSSQIRCVKCRVPLGDAQDFCFYSKSAEEVEFILKPELLHESKDKFIIVDKTSSCSTKLNRAYFDLLCKTNDCNAVVGKMHYHGNNSRAVVAFGKRSVAIDGEIMNSSRWRNRMHEPKYAMIDKRQAESNIALDRDDSEFVSIQNETGYAFESPKDFQWNNLLRSGKTPKDFQVQAFQRALLRNLLVVVPTGSGKTLIACMIMMRFKQVKHYRLMVAMVVDRVHLVHQQANVISSETGLSVCSLCGDTTTAYIIEKLFKGEFNCLVCTAGSLYDLISKEKAFKLNRFSLIVFDECHHAGDNDHLYTTLLDNIDRLSLRTLRLVGLSASPVKAPRVDSAILEITALKRQFGNAAVFRPTRIELSPVQEEWLAVETTPEQNEVKEICYAVIKRSLKELGGLDEDVLASFNERLRSSWGNLVGIARHFKSRYPSMCRTADDIERHIAALERNDLLGPNYAMKFLKGGSEGSGYSASNDTISPHLAKLEEELNKCEENSRILIFVETKDAAYELRRRLVESVPQFPCGVVVGQNNFKGMNRSSQVMELRKFRNGELKMIICTSVLEEGIDVKECDYVFRIGCQFSLIQMIQSRGRARSKFGKFKVILSIEEKGLFSQLSDQERFLTDALSDVLNKSEDEKILNEEVKASSEGIVPPEDDNITAIDSSVNNFARSDYLSETSEVGLKLYVNSCSIDFLKKELMKDLRSYGRILEFTNIVIIPGVARIECVSKDFLEDSDSMITLGMKVVGSLESFLWWLASVWKFQISSHCAYMPLHSFPLNVGTEITNGADSKEIDCVLGISEVVSGFLTDRRTFSPSASSKSWNNGFSFSIMRVESKKEIQLIGSCGDYEIMAVISIESLQSSLLISADNLTSCFTCFISLLFAPTVQLRNDTSAMHVWLPFDSPGYKDDSVEIETARDVLKSLTNRPVIAVKFELARNDWESTMTLFHRSREYLGVDTFITRVLTGEQCGQYDINLFTPIPPEKKYESNVSIETASSPSLQPQEDINSLVQLAILESMRYHLAIHPKALLSIRNSIYVWIDKLKGNLKDGQNRFQPVEACLEQLIQIVKVSGPWFNATSAFNTLRSSMESHDVAMHCVDIENYTTVLSLTVTPSRVIFDQSKLIKSSRLLRAFSDRYKFAYIQFREENGKNIFNLAIYKSRYLEVLQSGLEIYNRCKFHFLLSSSSQCRDQTAILICCKSVAEKESVLDSLIPTRNDDFRDNPSKHMSRLGQFCTADSEVYDDLLYQAVHDTDDSYTSGSNRILTDGAGLIRASELTKLKQKYPTIVPENSSAIQFRQSGRKGVLCEIQDSDLVDVFPLIKDATIVFRNSTKKFESPHNQLCVVKASSFVPLVLNQEILALLFSLRYKFSSEPTSMWSPAKYVYDLQERELNRLAKSLTNASDACRALRSQCMLFDEKSFYVMSNNGFDILTEPMWANTLQAMYRHSIKSLRSKSHIPLSSGARLIGVPDPVDCLSDNEIFLKVQRERNSEPEVITGSVLIFRNPSLDPGDIRLVTAVDKPQLGYLLNVVVIPAANKKITRSLSEECSGGDLDGDEFAIIWDANIIPPIDLIFDPVDYVALASDARVSSSGPDVLYKSCADFVVSAMANSHLGKIARTHLAISDQLPQRAADPIARNLARQQSIAVDFPKTGVPPQIPQEVRVIVKENGYPSFMESKTKKSYSTTEPLGILYDRCVTIAGTADSKWQVNERKIVLDSAFIVTGREKYQQEADDTYRMYIQDITAFLVRFGLQSEFELIGCCALEKFNEYNLQWKMADATKSLMLKYKKIFYFNTNGDQNAIVCKISAWYYAAYVTGNSSGQYRPTLLSFPWLLMDCMELLFMKTNSNVISLAALNGTSSEVEALIGADAHQYWSNGVDELSSVVKAKLNCFEIVKNCAMTYDNGKVAVYLYGSVSHLLCDCYSDIDVYLSSLDGQNNDILFLRDIQSVLTKISLDMNLINGDVKLLKLLLESPNNDIPLKVDVSLSRDGFLKAQYIQWFYLQSTANLVVMSSLVEWAKCCGLVTNDTSIDVHATLKKGEFHALVLAYFHSQLPTYDSERNSNICASQSNDFPDKFLNFASEKSKEAINDVGMHILQFFESYSSYNNVDEGFKFIWPVEGKPYHVIGKEKMIEVCKWCGRAYHCLAASRSFSFLLSHTEAMQISDTEATIELSPLLSEKFRYSTSYYQLQLEFSSGAKVTISPSINGKMAVFGKGTPAAIMRLKKKVYQLTNVNNRMFDGAVCNPSAKYFMDGASYLYVRGSSVKDAESLSCQPYLGERFNRQHGNKSRHIIVQNRPAKEGSNDIESVDWQVNFSANLRQKILDQLDSLQKNPEAAATLSMSVHFGTFYLFNAESFFGVFKNDLSLSDIERELLNLQASNRKVFEREYPNNPVEQAMSNSNKPEAPANDSKSGNTSNWTRIDSKEMPMYRKPKSGNLNISFWSSIEGEKTPVASFEEVVGPFRRLFLSLGYNEVQASWSAVETAEADGVKSAWKVEVCPSAHFCATVRLDDQARLTSICERSLYWLHGTLLSAEQSPQSHAESTQISDADGEQQPHDRQHLNIPSLRNHDVRYKIFTNTPLPPEHALRKAVLGEEDSLPVTLDDNGWLAFKPGTTPDQICNVTFARKTEKVAMFMLCSQGIKVRAVLSSGWHCDGDGLKDKIPYTDLGLDVDMDTMREWAGGTPVHVNGALFNPAHWIDTIITHSIEVSKGIRNLCSNQ